MTKPRGRDLGLPFPGETGPHNAITDVPGIEVGFRTRIEGDGPLVQGQGPVRSGVTARGSPSLPSAMAAAVRTSKLLS